MKVPKKHNKLLKKKLLKDSLEALVDDHGVDIVICIAFFAPPGITENLIDIVAEIIFDFQYIIKHALEVELPEADHIIGHKYMYPLV